MPRTINANKKMARILSAVENALDDIEELENMPVMMQAETEEKPEEEDGKVVYTEKDYEDYLDEQLNKELAEDEGSEPFDSSILDDDDEEEDEEDGEIETASEQEFGVEDTIGDTKNGGEKSTSQSVEVDGFGEDANSQTVAPKEVVAAIKSLCQRFDVAANRYQKAGNMRMAYRIDRCSDRLEKMFRIK